MSAGPGSAENTLAFSAVKPGPPLHLHAPLEQAAPRGAPGGKVACGRGGAYSRNHAPPRSRTRPYRRSRFLIGRRRASPPRPPAEDIKAAVWSWEHHWELGACFFGTNWLLPGCYLPELLVFCACLLPPHPPRSALRPQPCVGPSPASPPPAWKGQYELGGCPETRCFYLFILGGVTGFYLFLIQ